MRFVDANIFLYAFLKTGRKLSEREIMLKRVSRNIVERIEKDEKVLTSAVHVSEVSNMLESLTSNETTYEIIESVLLNNNIEIAEVGKEIYVAALEIAKTHKVSINDCVASVIMNTKNVSEIYSFDSDFDKIDGIIRIEK